MQHQQHLVWEPEADIGFLLMCHCTYVIAANPSCKTEVDMWQRSRLQTHCPTCNLDSMLCAGARTPMSWKKQLSVLFTLLAFSLKVFVCLFFPLSSSPVSVLNLMWLGLSAWRNNRNWKITERMKCKNINLRRALTIKKVLKKGERCCGYTLLKCMEDLGIELKQWQDTERLSH